MALTLTQYLLAYLGNLNNTLNYAENDLSIVIEDALSDYGVTTEIEANDFLVEFEY